MCLCADVSECVEVIVIIMRFGFPWLCINACKLHMNAFVRTIYWQVRFANALGI